MESINTQNLAEQITQLLQSRDKNDSLRVSLENINRRLNQIESQISSQNPKSKIQNIRLNHPSQEKFLNLEELADEIFNRFSDEKICPYEPTAKPCDNCSMCNSRGF